MTELKKTLQQGTPSAAGDAEVSRQAAVSPQGGQLVASGVQVMRPASMPESIPATPSGAGAPASDAYVPPPAGNDELSHTRPPAGHRTPSATRQAPSFGSPMPENAPGWMLRARRMSLALEEAIRDGTPPPALEACIERAWAAWELDGSEDKQIARVARLVDNAHTAIRETTAKDLETAYNECAQVLWAGLPRQVKAKQEFAQVLNIVRDLRAEADSWAAVVDATSRLLGWSRAARAHAAHAVRVAVLSEK
jgi:hypothetical protein